MLPFLVSEYGFDYAAVGGLMFAAAGAYAYTLKSSKMHKKPEGTVKAIRYLALLLGLVMVALIVYTTIQMDTMQDKLVREGPMIMPADGEEIDEETVQGDGSLELLVVPEDEDESEGTIRASMTGPLHSDSVKTPGGMKTPDGGKA